MKKFILVLCITGLALQTGCAATRHLMKGCQFVGKTVTGVDIFQCEEL